MRERKRGFLSSFFSFVFVASAGLVILALFYLIDQNTQKLADIEQRLGDIGAETRDALKESQRLHDQSDNKADIRNHQKDRIIARNGARGCVG